MPVLDQDEPVAPDEYILRRILNNKDYINLDLPIPVQRAAVGPTKRDTDGLSVYREKFVSPREVAESGNNSAGYYVVRFNAQDIFDMGLDIIPDKIEDGLQGHSLVPQLSTGEKKSNRKLYVERTLALTKLISTDDIVFSPDD